MWTRSDLSSAAPARRVSSVRRFARALPFALGLVLALHPSPAAAAAPRQGAGAGTLSASEQRQLRQQLERRYEPISISNGVLLRARQERLGVRTVEVSGDSIVVNGARVGPEVLRSWLGDADAEPILRLAALPPAARQELFGLKRSISGSAPAAPQAGAGADERRTSGGSSETATEDRRPSAGSAGSAGSSGSAGTAEEDRRMSAGSAGSRSSGAGTATPPADESERTESSDLPPEPPSPPAAPTPPTPPSPLAAPTPPTPPSPTVNTGSRVRLGGPVTVERNEIADDVAVFGGPVHVEGEVSHDVVAIGGSVRINGRVGGDVHSIGGGVHLGPRAEVMGDVTTAGGAVVREPGARVHGNVSEAGGPFPGIGWTGGPGWIHHGPFRLFFPFGISVFSHVTGLLVLLLLASLAMLIARRSFERVDFELAARFWHALLAGFLAQLVFLPLLAVVTVVLAISIVGCALFLLYPVVFVMLVLVGVLGFSVACYRTGRWLEHRFEWRPASPWAALLIGFLAIEVWSLFGDIFGGMRLYVLSAIFGSFGLAVRYVAWTSGFGAAILAYSRYRERRRAGQWDVGEIPRPPAPPPPPASPTSPSVPTLPAATPVPEPPPEAAK